MDDPYLKEKIKDKKVLEAIKRIVSDDKAFMSLDIADIKAVVGDSQDIHIFYGDGYDFAGKVAEPERIKGAVLSFEAPEETDLDSLKSAIEKITDTMNDDVNIVWGGKLSKEAEKITFTAVLAY